MKRLLLLLPLLVASCSNGVNLKSGSPFQATCLRNKVETVITIDPDIENASVVWTPIDDEDAEETTEIWPVTKITHDQIVIKSPFGGNYSPLVRVQFNRDTRQVFIGNVPPLDEVSCTFSRLDV